MNQIFPAPENYSQTLHRDEARCHTANIGTKHPGASMVEQVTSPEGENSRKMKDLVYGLAKALVDSPDSVSVEAIEEANATVLRLRVATTDIGKVIGKQGRTARSIRTILSAASMKIQHRFSLDILEEGQAPRG